MPCNAVKAYYYLGLGSRQTGKTTLILQQIQPDIYYTLIKPSIRQRYEQDLPLFERELAEQVSQYQNLHWFLLMKYKKFLV